MNKRFLAVLAFAFIVALGASLMLYRLTSKNGQTTKAAPAAIKLVLASRDLEIGTLLRAEDVAITDWPGAVPIGSAMKPDDVVGRGVISKIMAKEPILDSRLAPKGAGYKVVKFWKNCSKKKRSKAKRRKIGHWK